MWRVLTILLVVSVARSSTADQPEEIPIPHNEVKNWALKFGVDLWEFGKHFTKMNQIQNKYHEYGVEVTRRDGLLLLREVAAEVRNFVDFKLNAVMRLMDSAEQAGTSGSPGYSGEGYYDSRWINVHSGDGNLAERARNLLLTPSRHFDHLAVNTSYSAVLVPPNVPIEDPEIMREVKWTEHLDPIFNNNFETDPSLSWQYYASANGFLRRFPAMSWPPEDGFSHHARDFYDFRLSHWFVEAASSPKDIVILLEEGSGRLGAHSANAVLEMLGPNDFVNVFQYGDNIKHIHPCFENKLVQATTESIRELRQAVWSMHSASASGSANLTAAFTYSFDLLHHYNLSKKGCQCNQAIVVIGSGQGIAGARRVFGQFNWPHKPVRVFTLAVGADSSAANALNDAACSNKGYYSYISETHEIRPAVLNIVRVMARPMVLYQSDHPARFSPVYVGGRSSSLADDGFGQLMMSVTMPVFDRRNHTQKDANLLGVVGTDVPIEEIKKLIPPYKLGVNGYAFLLDNNGYVMFHPDLRPVHTNEEYTETLRPTYVNVDLTEVELLSDNEIDSRTNYTSLLLDLRRQMIDQVEGETELLVNAHVERVKRVSTRRQRYYHAPLPRTPFSLAVVLPDGYGQYDMIAQQEIKWTTINVTEYFKGNWKVHPDWVYCNYDSETVKFTTAEERILHFLSRSNKPGWKWMSVRPRAAHNSHHKHEKDSYFCDKTLMQSLVRDAMVIKEVDGLAGHHSHHNHQGYEKFGVVLSFIATRSGLFKWTENNNTRRGESLEPHFSEKYARAIDSEWYRRAVEHHATEPESFVFAVEEGTGVVSAAHALFVESRGHRAPAAVVGLHFHLHTLAKHFINVTSTCTPGNACTKTCAGDELDCYILDDSGFVIISEKESQTGKFFGNIDGTIMDSLVQDRIYKRVAIFDHQGKCPDGDNPFIGRSNMLRPLGYRLIVLWFKYFLTTWMSLWDVLPVRARAEDETDDFDIPEDYEDDDTEPLGRGEYEIVVEGGTSQVEVLPVPPPAPSPIPATAGLRACRTQTNLYALQSSRLNASQPLKGKLTNCHNSGCERPFSVQKIRHSNLILLVVDTLCPCGHKTLAITPTELPDECRAHETYRRRPPPCINYHPEEIDMSCGEGSNLRISLAVFLFVASLGALTA